MGVRRIFKKAEKQSAEELAALLREREYFQRERPGLEDCEAVPLPGETQEGETEAPHDTAGGSNGVANESTSKPPGTIEWE